MKIVIKHFVYFVLINQDRRPLLLHLVSSINTTCLIMFSSIQSEEGLMYLDKMPSVSFLNAHLLVHLASSQLLNGSSIFRETKNSQWALKAIKQEIQVTPSWLKGLILNQVKHHLKRTGTEEMLEDGFNPLIMDNTNACKTSDCSNQQRSVTVIVVTRTFKRMLQPFSVTLHRLGERRRYILTFSP